MRATVPSAISGPGVLPSNLGTGQTLAGLAEHAATVVGNSGRAAFVQAKTLVVKPGSADSVAFVINMIGSEFTSDIMRIQKDDDTSVLTINNNGVMFAYRGITVATTTDTQPRLHLDQADGSISLGDGTNPTDWSLTWLSANTATLGADDNLIIPGTLSVGGNTVSGGYADYAKFGTD